jgi:hypothetical protein
VVALGTAVLLVTAGVVTAAVSVDFGLQTQNQLGQRAEQLFGVKKRPETRARCTS